MSYCCSASGDVVVKSTNDIQKVIDIFNEHFEADVNTYGNEKNKVFIYYPFDKYHENEVKDILNKVNDYVASGLIEYQGEDGELWAYKKDDGDNNFYECRAEIVYHKEQQV